MLRNQLLNLDSTGNELLAKARASVSVKDVREFTELGLKCLAEARAIFETQRQNSLLFFAEMSLAIGFEPRFAVYLDFCARNGLEVVSETDFEMAMAAVGGDGNKKTLRAP